MKKFLSILLLLSLFCSYCFAVPFEVTVPSRATGGFGNIASGWEDMVGAGAFGDGDILTIIASGTIYVNPTKMVGPDGWGPPVDGYEADETSYTPLEEKEVDAGTFPAPRPNPVPHAGALIGAFVPELVANTEGFLARDDDYTGVGYGISSQWLFYIGPGPMNWTAPEDGTLYFGINDWWAANNSGEFTVTPEPATLLLFGLGVPILSGLRRK